MNSKRLKLALDIGEKLKESSITTENGVSWVSVLEEEQMTVLSKYNLYNGASGPLVFLSALYDETESDKIYSIAEKSFNFLKNEEFLGSKEKKDGLVGSFSTLYALRLASRWLENGDSVLKMEEELKENYSPNGELDIISGIPGTFLLLSEEESQELRYKLANTILRKSEKSKLKPNFAHGQFGVGYALSEAYNSFGEEKFRKESKKTLQSGLSNINESSSKSWCRGRSGALLSIYGASKNGVEISTSETQMNASYPNTIKEDILCHGNAGLAEVFIQKSRDSNCESCLDKVDRILEVNKQNYDFRIAPVELRNQEKPSFFRGISGIGYTLLRANNHDLPSVALMEEK